MKKKVLTLTFIGLLGFSTNGLCDSITPLANHTKEATISFKSSDYKSAIMQSCNALYHGRQKSTAYLVLAKSYEALGDYLSAMVSYMKLKECCNPNDVEKVDKKISSLKDKVNDEALKKALSNTPEKVLISESFFKKDRVYRTRDYIFNPMGQIIEEKYCKPNNTYEYRIEYTYDKEGVLVEKMKFDEMDRLMETESVSYAEGRKVQETRRGPGGNVLGDKTFLYDLGGNVKSIMTHNANNELIFEETFLYTGSNVYEKTSKDYKDQSTLENYTARYSYKDGKLAEKEILYKMGLFERVKFFYRGEQLLQEVYYSTKSEPVKSKKYAYSSNGDLHEVGEYEIKQRKKDLLQTKTEYQYSRI